MRVAYDAVTDEVVVDASIPIWIGEGCRSLPESLHVSMRTHARCAVTSMTGAELLRGEVRGSGSSDDIEVRLAGHADGSPLARVQLLLSGNDGDDVLVSRDVPTQFVLGAGADSAVGGAGHADVLAFEVDGAPDVVDLGGAPPPPLPVLTPTWTTADLERILAVDHLLDMVDVTGSRPGWRMQVHDDSTLTCTCSNEGDVTRNVSGVDVIEGRGATTTLVGSNLPRVESLRASHVRGGEGTNYIVASHSATGGSGPDYIRSTDGKGGLVADGGGGSDVIVGSSQADRLAGGDGNDLVDARWGKDLIDAGAGNDYIVSSDDHDDSVIRCGAGRDVLDANSTPWDWTDGTCERVTRPNDVAERVTLPPVSHRDMHRRVAAYFGAGNDVVRGNNGHNTFYLEQGNDTVWGQSGNDRLMCGTGRDTAYGGTGNDVVDCHDRAGGDVVDGGPGWDTCHVDRADTVRSCERIIYRPWPEPRPKP